MSSRHRLLVLLFALGGLAATGASTYVHYQLLRNPGYTSFCDISATVNCESVYQSVYGTVLGVPVALAGLLWFLLVLLLAWVDRPAPAVALGPAEARRGRAPAAAPAPPASETSSYLFVLSTAALAVVLYMAYASFFVLKTLCVLCAVTYVAVIGVFVISGAASQSAMRFVPGRLAADLRRLLKSPVALTIACVYLVGAASAIAFFPRPAPAAPAAAPSAAAPAVLPAVQESQLVEFERWMAAQPRVPVMVADDGAAVVIVKFNDYQCPPCRQTYTEYKPILERYQAQHPGKVKYVSKDFPLEAECNTGGVHVAGCEAAAAVRMARNRNRADAMESWLFDNQASMSPDLVRQGVRQVAGVTDFDAQYPKVLEQVRADAAQGRQLGVNRTPTFFINGVKIEGGLRPQFFDAAIAYELKRSTAARQ
ncbi:MAG: vitamin K epoxide reductase family protein [Vicinamibacterales bacterium]